MGAGGVSRGVTGSAEGARTSTAGVGDSGAGCEVLSSGGIPRF